MFGLNLDADRSVRHGFVKKYTPTGISDKICVAVENLVYASTWPGVNATSVVVAAWSDGSITVDGGASVATASFTSPLWMKFVPCTIPAWDSSSSSWLPKNVLILYTDTKVYIFDPLISPYLVDVAVATPSAPSAGTTSAGRIPAGTYKFVATEITRYGIETAISAAATVADTSDFQVTLTPAAAANADAVRWRLYMSKESDVTGQELYRIVGEADIASTITANLTPVELGLAYDNARIATPQTVTTGCIHQGLLVSAGDSKDPSSIFVSAISVNELGNGLTGFPEVGHAIATYSVANQEKIVAVASVSGHLLAFTRHGIYGIYGTQIATGEDIQIREVSNAVGTRNDRTVVVLGDRVYFSNYDCSRAYVSDGYTVQDITEESGHLFSGVWYLLNGAQAMSEYAELQGRFVQPLVIADPYHNKVWFGGETVSTAQTDWVTKAEAGTWETAMYAAQPQSNRQYVWKVYDINSTKWLTWNNIPAKSYCLKDGEVWFGDHRRHIWALNQKTAKDGAVTGVLVTSAVSTSTGTTITTTNTWAGTAILDAPVVIFNTSNGSTQLRYAVSATSNTLVIDRAANVTTNDIIMYGVPVVDVWTQPIAQPAKIHAINWFVQGQSLDGYATGAVLMKTRAAYTTWHRQSSWVPVTAGRGSVAVGLFCPSMMMRVILPAANGLATNLETSYNLVLKAFSIDGVSMPKAKW